MSQVAGPPAEVPAHPGLQVSADLSLEVDGTLARLTGSGQHLALHADSPATALAALGPAARPAGLGRLADALRSAGLRLDITSGRGTLAVLGAGVDSFSGRLATGSRAVAAGSPRVLFPLAYRRLQDAIRPRRRHRRPAG